MNKMQIHLAVQAFRSAFQKQMQAVNRLIRAHKEMPETVTLYEVECALEYWVIFTHRTLEAFILDSLLWTLNRNHHLLELATGGRVKVPALTLGTWNYLVEGDEYFDLKDYGDLVQRTKAFLPYERSLNGTFNQAKTHPSSSRWNLTASLSTCFRPCGISRPTPANRPSRPRSGGYRTTGGPAAASTCSTRARALNGQRTCGSPLLTSDSL